MCFVHWLERAFWRLLPTRSSERRDRLTDEQDQLASQYQFRSGS